MVNLIALYPALSATLVSAGILNTTTITLNGSTANSTPLPTNESYEWMRDLGNDIRKYCFAILIPIGLFFNTLAMTVLLTSHLHKTTTGHYLCALAVADNIFLIGDFIRWLNPLAGYFMNTNDPICRSTYFLRYFGKLMSCYFTVTITLERFLTIRWPLKIATMSTPKVAKIAILVETVLSAALGAFPFWTIRSARREEDQKWDCTILDVDKKEYDIWSWVVLRVGVVFLPGFIVFVFTVLIIRTLNKMAAFRRGQLTGQEQGNNQESKDKQLTNMLLAVAIVFVTIRLPYTINYMLFINQDEIWPDMSSKTEDTLLLFLKITEVLALVNYCINFFLYYFTGSSFRCQLWKMIHLKKRKKGVTSYTRSTHMSESKVHEIENGEHPKF